MYRRAVITDEISQDLDLAVAMAADFGLDGIEVRTAWDVRIDRMSPEQLRRVRDVASARGLVVASLASPVFKCAIDDPAEVAEHFEILKRCMDVVGAILGLIISIPLMLFFGILIYLESPGPVLYRQIRMGRNGRTFEIIKLRSMRLGAEAAINYRARDWSADLRDATPLEAVGRGRSVSMADDTVRETWRRWYFAFFQPLQKSIRKRGLQTVFPGERSADILVRLAHFRDRKSTRLNSSH